MATTLAEIRARLKAQDDRKSGTKSTNSDNTVYPHWDIPEGTLARIRFLPDGNAKNPFGFWVERSMIKLEFKGIKGQADSKPVIVQVPCMEMYGEACPVLAEVRPWFKDPSLEEMGRKYWKKKSFIFQGFVRDNPLATDKTPENPIRRFTISPQIINIIIASLKDPEMENIPTDYENGLDFNIKKTSKGGYADYSTSTWSRKETALTVDEQEAIEKHGLYDLSEFLPKKPTDADLKVIKEMFEASVDGQPYDADRWGAYYKPYGLDTGNAKKAPVQTESTDSATPTESADSTPPFDADEGSTATAPVEAKPSSQKAEDILAMIRNRQKQ
jgi:hypothetical protein